MRFSEDYNGDNMACSTGFSSQHNFPKTEENQIFWNSIQSIFLIFALLVTHKLYLEGMMTIACLNCPLLVLRSSPIQVRVQKLHSTPALGPQERWAKQYFRGSEAFQKILTLHTHSILTLKTPAGPL